MIIVRNGCSYFDAAEYLALKAFHLHEVFSRDSWSYPWSVAPTLASSYGPSCVEKLFGGSQGAAAQAGLKTPFIGGGTTTLTAITCECIIGVNREKR